MFNKTWSVQYKDTQIDVTNQHALLPPKNRKTLSIDGQLVHERDSHMLQHQTYLAAPLNDQQGQSLIEALIAPAGLFGVGCHIYADGQLIGGDTTKKLNAYSSHEWKEIKQRGISRFLLVRGLVLAGLPFGIGMTFLQTVGFMASWSSLLFSFVFHTTVFGLAMGYFFWWSLNNAFEGQA